DFARQREEPPSTGRMLDRLARELDGARAVLSIRADRLSEVARAFATLSNHTGSGPGGALPDLCRLLRVAAPALSLTADPISALPDPAQLAYAAALHQRAALKQAAEEVASAKGKPYLQLCWTTAEAARSLRHRLRSHDGQILGCSVSADGLTGLSASDDRTLIVWDLATGQQ